MSADAAAVSVPAVAAPRGSDAWRRDRRFFTGLMVVVGFAAAVDAARRGSTPPGGPPPLVFMAIPMADLAIFSTLVGAGIWFRRRAEVHKRLMLTSTIAILTPAIARLAISGTAAWLAFATWVTR